MREVKAYITDAQKFAVLVAKSGIKQGSSVLKDYAAGEFNRLMKFSNQDPLKNRDEEYKHIRTKDKRRLTKDVSALDVGSFPECSSEFGQLETGLEELAKKNEEIKANEEYSL